MKILCVDDHPVHLQSLAQSVMSVRPEAEIFTFNSARKAQSFAVKNGCDVLLCEIDLVGGDGILLAENLQELNPRLNIIFVTVCGEHERAKEVLRLHPSGYLTKPFTQQQLSQELMQLRHPIDRVPNILCSG